MQDIFFTLVTVTHETPPDGRQASITHPRSKIDMPNGVSKSTFKKYKEPKLIGIRAASGLLTDAKTPTQRVVSSFRNPKLLPALPSGMQASKPVCLPAFSLTPAHGSTTPQHSQMQTLMSSAAGWLHWYECRLWILNCPMTTSAATHPLIWLRKQVGSALTI